MVEREKGSGTERGGENVWEVVVVDRSNSTSSITFQIPYMGSFTDLGLQGRQYFIYIRQDLI